MPELELARKKTKLRKIDLLVDGGYSGDCFATEVHQILNATVEVVKRNELHQFVVLPKRWIVEHSFNWLEKCCRL